jgi:hypothetical protein
MFIDQGISSAQKSFGDCLENGLEIEKDLVRALKIAHCLLTKEKMLDRIASVDAFSLELVSLQIWEKELHL